MNACILQAIGAHCTLSRKSSHTQINRVFQGMSASYDFWIDNGLALVGSPDTVIRQLKEQHQRIGYDIFCANHRIGLMPSAQSLKSLQLFGKEVIPAFT
jgi:alkanesulfonate monooxygenase SsuD/methylene tetrahydromethanopterin reductase-like flavin-dependent oxidoreductase (luciferase family)